MPLQRATISLRVFLSYVIKDYNTNGGGVYAEYYTPHAIAVIMARLLVGDRQDLHNIECYDPAAGTGTLLMALGHQVGEDRCTIFAQVDLRKVIRCSN